MYPNAGLYSPGAPVDPFQSDLFYIDRLMLPIIAQYRIYNAGHQLLLTAAKSLMPIPARIEFRTPDNQRLMSPRQDHPLQLFSMTFTLYDAAGAPHAYLRRGAASRLLTYAPSTLDGSPLWSVTDTMHREIARVNFAGDLVMSNCYLTRPDGAMLGHFQRRITITDKHTLDLRADIMRSLDRRIAVALGVLLDNIEH